MYVVHVQMPDGMEEVRNVDTVRVLGHGVLNITIKTDNNTEHDIGYAAGHWCTYVLRWEEES